MQPSSRSSSDKSIAEDTNSEDDDEYECTNEKNEDTKSGVCLLSIKKNTETLIILY